MVQRKPLSDLIGRTFNRLTVVDYLGKRSHGKHWWLCACSCGGFVELNTSRLTGNSPTKSCGCLRKERLKENRADPTKHGYTISHPKLYAIYYGMMQRCYNQNSQRYKYYGGRGVDVCLHWRQDVAHFVNWSLEFGYEEGLSIDRRNASIGYCPANCEWVSVSENSRRMNEARRNEGSTT